MKLRRTVLPLLALTLGNLLPAKAECDCKHFPWPPECDSKCSAAVLNNASPAALSGVLRLDRNSTETVLRKRSKQNISSVDQLRPDLSEAEIADINQRIKSLNRGQADELLRIYVNISQPAREGAEVGREMEVEGTASIPEGNRLWVLVHVVDGFEDFWWPEGEGKIDPATHHWRVHVIFGQAQDIGKDFEIAVITVRESEHLELRDWLRKGMTSGVFRPMEMPPTTTAPRFRTVKKVN